MVAVVYLSKKQSTGVVMYQNMFRVNEMMMSIYHNSSRIIQTINIIQHFQIFQKKHFQYVQKKHFKKRKEEEILIKERLVDHLIRAVALLNLWEWEVQRTLKARALNSQMSC